MQYTLEDLRERINLLDRGLLNIMLQRVALIPLVAEIKKRDSLPITQPDREKRIFESLEGFSKDNGISFDVLKTIYETIITYSKEIEEHCLEQKDSKDFEVFDVERDSKEVRKLHRGTMDKLIEFNSDMECIKKLHNESAKYGDFVDFMTLLAHGEISKKYL